MDAKNLKEMFMKELWKELARHEITPSAELEEFASILGDSIQPQIDIFTEIVNNCFIKTAELPSAGPIEQYKDKIYPKSTIMIKSCDLDDEMVETIKRQYNASINSSKMVWYTPILGNPCKEVELESADLDWVINDHVTDAIRYATVNTYWNNKPIIIKDLATEDLCSHSKKYINKATQTHFWVCPTCKKDLGNA